MRSFAGAQEQTPLSGDPVAVFERARAAVLAERRGATWTAWLVFALAVAGSTWISEVSLVNLAKGLPGVANYFREVVPVIRLESPVADVRVWYWGFWKWLGLLGDTILIAWLGTLIGGVAGLLLSFLASRNLAPSRTASFLARRFMEFARSVPELVFALIFVFSFGLGLFPGVLAIAVHTTGGLGKLFAEAMENAAKGPIEGLKASGASWAQTMRFAVVPQVLPNVLSYGLMRFEINVRSASVLGFVGAGGIGQELMLVIRQFVYEDVSAITLMIILAVVCTDLICERLRTRVMRETGNTGKAGRALRRAVLLALAAVTAYGVYKSGVLDWKMLTNGLARLGKTLAFMFPPTPPLTWADALDVARGMGETLGMAFLGTLIAAILAVPLGFLGASTVVRAKAPRFLLRRIFDLLRGIDPLIWALVVINVVGLGPFAGVMAMAIGDLGVLSKLYAEAIENTPPGPTEGVRAAGASEVLAMRYGMLPQAMPVMLSSALYYFESNVRHATILGVVGAGGIGLQLSDRIRIHDWQEASFLILLILVTVFVIDQISAAIRERAIGCRTAGSTKD